MRGGLGQIGEEGGAEPGSEGAYSGGWERVREGWERGVREVY